MNSLLNSIIHRVCRPIRYLTLRTPGLIPVQGIEHNGRGYISSSQECEPCFELHDPLLLPGWYMLELQIASSIISGNALVCINYGRDQAGEIKAFLPYTSARGTKRIVRLEGGCQKLFFYPLEGINDPKIRFAVNSLCFVPLLPFYARELMLARLKARDPEFQGMDHKEIMKLAGSMTQLKKKYDSTFFRHLDHGAQGYRTWIMKHESVTFDEKVGPGAVIDAHMPSKEQLFSLLIPVQRAGAENLRRTLESVWTQTLFPTEVCLIKNDSFPPDLEKMSQDLFSEKLNFRFIKNDQVLLQAKGRYIVLVDPGDTLPPHALMQAAMAYMDNSRASVIYSDHDFLDEQGNRIRPSFKPDWNPDLLLGYNYIFRMAALDRKLLLKAQNNGWDINTSQEHQMLLACAALSRPEHIVHIPQVLYHRNAIYSRSVCAQEARPALERFLRHQGCAGDVHPGPFPGSYRIRYALPNPAPRTSIIIPSRDQARLLEKCITSILEATDYPNYEILLVDNGSRQKAALKLLDSYRRHPLITVLTWDRPFNYSLINNFAAARAKGRLLALLNNDIEIMDPHWLTEMASHACRPEIGCVGAKLFYPDGTIQHGGVVLGLGGVAGHAHRFFPGDHPGYDLRLNLIQNMSAVTGACLVVRKSVFDQVGGLETDLAVTYNDVDFCLKVQQAGYRNLWTPFARLYHHESKSRGTADTPEKKTLQQKEQDYMKKKWGHILYKDPCYNPNLTLQFEDFSLRNTSFSFDNPLPVKSDNT